MHRRPLVLLVALAVVSVVGLVGWLAARDTGPSVDVDLATADVVVIGDSVTDQSHDQIVAAMPGREVQVIGLSGLRTDQLLPVVEDVLGGDDRPAVAVVMAGYNDVWQGAEREAPIRETMAAMAGVACPVWVVVPTAGPWDRDRARAFDERVRDEADDARVAVATEWRDAVDAGDEDGPALVTPDGVHPSEAGKQRVAEVMAAAVGRACG